MGKFTFVPVWVIQDIIVYIVAILLIIYIVRNEKHPEITLLELICFILLDASVFENFATLMGWYGYGRSVIMVFNVPLSVPLIEYLVVYSTLKLLETTEIPGWCKPLIVGMFGILFDFSLDPLAVRQVFNTAEATIGRWSWFIGATDVNIFSVPVYNFSGWMLLCGWAAAFIVLGRYWFAKSGYKKAVGYVYPPLAMILSLIMIVSPLSNFLLWLGPIFKKGGFAEWIMLGIHVVVPTVLLLIFQRKNKTKEGLTWKKDYPVFIVLIGFHLVNIIFAIIGKHWEIIPLQAGVMLIQGALTLVLNRRTRSQLSES